MHVAMDGTLYRSQVCGAGLSPPPATASCHRLLPPPPSAIATSLLSFSRSPTSPPRRVRQVVSTAERLDGAGSWCPVLILVPLRLGIESINPQYAPALSAFFAMPQCTGILGGKPRAAHYFLGVAGARLLYLDPHAIQPALRRAAPDVCSCHLSSPTIPSIPLLDLDPSVALGFLCDSRRTFDEFCSACDQLASSCLLPFSISETPLPIPCDDFGDEDDEDDELA